MSRPLYSSLSAILVGVAFFAGLQIGSSDTEASVLGSIRLANYEQPEEVDFSAFWKAWQLLEEKYIPATTTETISTDERVWGAIEGLAASYDDPYTLFLPPADSEMFNEDISGSFGGVGMEVGMRDGLMTIIAPLKDTPAEEAGLRAMDRIMTIDGEPTKGMSIDEAIRLIRGEVGTEVTLGIAREGEGELIEVPVTRAQIKIPTMTTTIRPDGVFVIELYNFGATAPQEFQRGLREFILSGSTHLVIDLRSNPGGYLEAAVDVASWFLPMGKVIVAEKFGSEGHNTAHRSRGYDIYRDHWDVVVLMNEGSASASEIVAGALNEHGIATTIGQQTFGKGSVQELVPVTPETSLKVTVARWLTPNGTSISPNGLTPDIEVEMTPEDIEAGRDPQLEKAVEFLLNGAVLPEEPETPVQDEAN
ncbi:PDZ domain-containing protein [Patescibacteria group bacterium]|jgi:carboxyl-terminal processing protease|nr:PDZ domain-containing protein [Patescibacteria group bacterium]